MRNNFKKYLLPVVVVAFLIMGVISVFSVDTDRIKSRWTNKIVVREIGFTGYAVYDIAAYIKLKFKTLSIRFRDPTPYREFLSKLNESDTQSKGPGFGLAKGKNVIYIQLESTDKLMLDVSPDGKPLMPFLSMLRGRS
ncbi:MAG: hypothetical protein KAR06_07290, partial [Deltaproteobacteria bacterium]|nr:hypothetical protein [Deltaproteobacteria bacterium]